MRVMFFDGFCLAHALGSRPKKRDLLINFRSNFENFSDVFFLTDCNLKSHEEAVRKIEMLVEKKCRALFDGILV